MLSPRRFAPLCVPVVASVLLAACGSTVDVVDLGAPIADAGGAPGQDGGPPEMDAGVDAGVEVDAGNPTPDLGVDAGPMPDGGVDAGVDGGVDGGVDIGVDMGPPPCGDLPGAGTVLYVDAGAPAGGDGLSWATAYDDLQDALAVATLDQEVWIAEGTYRPVVPVDVANVTAAERQAAFEPAIGVSLLGGFEGVEERACEGDPEAFLTILSGDLADDDVDSDLDGVSDTNLGDNSENVIRLDGATAANVISGLIIEGGTAALGVGNRRSGGGLLNEDGSPVIERVTFRDNRTTNFFGNGAGMASIGGSPVFRNVVFENNECDAQGGGLFLGGDGDVTIEGATFRGNSAVGQGGGLRVAGTIFATVQDAVFTDNSVTTDGGGNGGGGGVSVDAEGATLSRVEVLRNDASTSGGGLVVRTGEVRVSHAVFADNVAASRGGGVFASSGSIATLTLQYVVMVRNEAASGGAINARRDVRVSHATIVDNDAVSGGGGAGAVINNEASIRFHHSIIWNNTSTAGGAQVNGNGNSIAQSILEGDASPWDGRPTDLGSDGGGVLDVDPLFVDASDPEGPDGLWGTADDGLRLMAASPAVGRAGPSDILDIDQDGDRREVLQDFADLDGDDDLDEDVDVDFGGDPRLVGAGSDLGAYEVTGVAAAMPDILYVDDDATGLDDGTSWTDAYTDLQSALSAAEVGDEIWVAAGEYTPGDMRDDTFALRAGVALYGGFAGTETMRSMRDPDLNESVLSGEIGAVANSDNIQHVVTASGVGPDAILDGFSVSRGFDFRSGAGGLGGGLYLFGGAPTIRDVFFEDNEAGSGGAVFVSGEAEPRFVGCDFSSNEGWLGGAVFLDDAAVELSDAQFESNVGGSSGGAVHVDRDGRLRITHAVLFENESIQSGSSPGPGGGAIFVSNGQVDGSNLLFVDNHAVLGGALCAFNSGFIRLSHVTMSGNRGVKGGAVSAWNGSTIELANALLWANVFSTERTGPEGREVYTGSSGSAGGTVAFSHSIVEGGVAGVNTRVDCSRCAITDDDANGSGDPLFVDLADPAGPDEELGTADDGLRVTAGSPAEDGGTRADVYDIDRDDDSAEDVPDLTDIDGDDDRDEAVPTDVIGNTRDVGVDMDVGAYERP